VHLRVGQAVGIENDAGDVPTAGTRGEHPVQRPEPVMSALHAGTVRAAAREPGS
jgi:hypothetical protein